MSDAADHRVRAFRDTMSRFATGVSVVTTRAGTVLHGMTANAVASVSLDPMLVLVCVSRASRFDALLGTGSGFAITFLAQEQQPIAEWFAWPGRPIGLAQFARVAWRPGPVSGSPVLADGLAFVDCSVDSRACGGDHHLYFGRVEASGVLDRTGSPLLFFGGSFHRWQGPPPDQPARRGLDGPGLEGSGLADPGLAGSGLDSSGLDASGLVGGKDA